MNYYKIKNNFLKWFKYLVDYVHNVFLKIITLFIISFFGFGLYQIGFFKTNFIIAVMFITVIVYLIKELLYARARPTKILVVLIILTLANFLAELYAVSVFENIGINLV